jgi:two-component system, NarL family, nitrate/nitrite sensor histidine kinase NarX
VNNSSQLHKRIFASRLFPWLAAGMALLGISLLGLVQIASGRTWQGWGEMLLDAAGALIVAAAAYFLVKARLGNQQERKQLRDQLACQVRLVEETNQRLSAVFRLRSHFLDASDESEVVEWLLRLTGELKGVTGASFVPLDEHGQPLATQGYGAQPSPMTEAWVEYLASPAVRDRCSVCENHNHLSTSCPLLKGPYSETVGIYCLPIRRGEREYGVLNLYVKEVEKLNAETRIFLQSLVDETAMALEGIWLRKRELGALRQLQSVRQRADLSVLLSGLLENVQQSLEADFAILVVDGSENLLQGAELAEGAQFKEKSVCGEFPVQARPFVNGIIQGVIESAEPVILSNVTNSKVDKPGVWAVLAVPLLAVDQSPVGALLVGNHRAKNFHQRQLALLQTVAGQICLVVQNTRQIAELQFKTMMEERARLAREIHDGLAQTLGFLKLQSAQMLNYLERGDHQRLKQGMRTYYDALSAAYEDARYAIDDLRISPSGNRINAWIEQTILEFTENLASSPLDVHLDCLEVNSQVLSEVQAQLIRILQEALSNVRKHSGASHVWISCYEQGEDLVLEIRDDGKGFSPDDVSSHSQHGLRGMRERAELIGADFQVISKSSQGTTIRVCLPIRLGEIVL